VNDPFPLWVASLERRHLRDLTFPETRRALQALSSLYVERRARLAKGAALDGAGKRAAFALYYGPLHFLVVRAVVRALGASTPIPRLQDLGSGTGAAGAAWALEVTPRPFVDAVDVSGWAVDETRFTLAALGLRGRARRGDALRLALGGPRVATVAAFTLNELPDGAREELLARLLETGRDGAPVLVVEPLARRVAPWWTRWAAAAREAGGRDDEWRFPADLPDSVARLGRAAGLDPRELTARTVWLPGR
jgi:hypothetical protein